MGLTYGDPSTGEIVTYTGRIVRALSPAAETLCIEDIAHSLANLCRFTGHVRSFYSVAQHSVLASREVPEADALAALLHDASEAYLSDISRPVKAQPEIGAPYKLVEARLMAVIADRFGFAWPLPSSIHRIDLALLRSEQRDLMPDLLRVEGDDYLDYQIEPLPPGASESLFLNRYHELTGDTR